jgi:hypothetical protein
LVGCACPSLDGMMGLNRKDGRTMHDARIRGSTYDISWQSCGVFMRSYSENKRSSADLREGNYVS